MKKESKPSMYLLRFNEPEYNGRLFEIEQALLQLNAALSGAFKQELNTVIPDIKDIIFQVQGTRFRSSNSNISLLKSIIHKRLEAKYLIHGIELGDDQFNKHWERYKTAYNRIYTNSKLSAVMDRDKKRIKYDEGKKVFFLPDEAKEEIKNECSIYVPYTERLKLYLKAVESLNKLVSSEHLRPIDIVGVALDCNSDGFSVNISHYSK